MTKSEIKEVIHEVMAERQHICTLSPEDVASIKTVSSFLTRCRNAAGNIVMVILVVVALMGVGGILYLATAGHINLFKVFGLGV
jgi:hypothetical protein